MYRPHFTAPASAAFRIAPSVYFRHALAAPRWFGIWAAPAAVIIGLEIIAAVRGSLMLALIVPLFIIFIAVPMVVALVYFAIVFSPQAARSTLTHTVELRADGSLLIKYIADEDDSDEKAAGRRRLPADEHIAASEISRFRRTRSNLVYTLQKGDIVIVPIKSVKLSPCDACSIGDFD